MEHADKTLSRSWPKRRACRSGGKIESGGELKVSLIEFCSTMDASMQSILSVDVIEWCWVLGMLLGVRV